MLDLWESLGRVIANENGLGDAILALPLQPYQILTCPTSPAPPHHVALVIPADNYNVLSPLLHRHVTYQPVSMFSLGEWLRVLPAAGLGAKLTPLRDLVTKRLGCSAAFYAGLGAITVDQIFAVQVAADPLTTFPLLALAPADEVALLKFLATSTGPDDYQVRSRKFCDGFWPEPCFAKVRPYENPALFHPDLAGIQ